MIMGPECSEAWKRKGSVNVSAKCTLGDSTATPGAILSSTGLPVFIYLNWVSWPSSSIRNPARALDNRSNPSEHSSFRSIV